MGKRELLLIVGFLVVGMVAYRVTAPAGSDEGGFSIGRFIERIRSEIRGQNYEVQMTEEASADAAGASAVRLAIPRATVVVVGEERTDVKLELKATIFGADKAEAEAFKALVKAEVLREGNTLVVRAVVNRQDSEMRRAPRFQLTVKAPRRLVVLIGDRGGELEVRTMGGVTFERSTGRAMLTEIDGVVGGRYGRGSLEIDQAKGIDLEVERTELRLMRIAGETKLQARQSGDVRMRELRGPATLDFNRVEAEIEDMLGPLTLEAEGGVCKVRNPKGPIVMKGQRLTIEITLNTPVPVDAMTENDRIEIVLPTGGLTLQATAHDGQVRASDSGIAVQTTDNDQRATATLRGGGPLIKLETTRGEILIR
jgi:hypothetical protein